MERQRNEIMETKNIVVVAKIRVQSPIELETDFEMFKLHWRRTATETLRKIGEVKVIDIIT